MHKMTYVLRFIAIILTLAIACQLTGQEKVKWYTWEEGMTLQQETSKKVIVDLYTDWCGWCKKMDKATFQNPEIAKYMNKHYIAIKFNAEQKEDESYKGVLHKFMKSGRRGYHTLAAELTGGRLSYPTVVFLDENSDLIQALPGFLDAKTFDPVIKYFALDYHHSMRWADFVRAYNSGQEIPAPKNPNSKLVGQGKGN